jgi:hypothetical protein
VSDETTTGERHEPLVLETVVLVPSGQRARSEQTVCRSCWIMRPNSDGESSSLGRAPWPCEVVRLRERVAAMEALLREIHDEWRHDWMKSSGYEREIEQRVYAALAAGEGQG